MGRKISYGRTETQVKNGLVTEDVLSVEHDDTHSGKHLLEYKIVRDGMVVARSTDLAVVVKYAQNNPG